MSSPPTRGCSAVVAHLHHLPRLAHRRSRRDHPMMPAQSPSDRARRRRHRPPGLEDPCHVDRRQQTVMTVRTRPRLPPPRQPPDMSRRHRPHSRRGDVLPQPLERRRQLPQIMHTTQNRHPAHRITQRTERPIQLGTATRPHQHIHQTLSHHRRIQRMTDQRMRNPPPTRLPPPTPNINPTTLHTSHPPIQTHPPPPATHFQPTATTPTPRPRPTTSR